MSIDGYEDVPVNNEAALAKAVSSQPISVAICASQAMQFYSSGVIAGEGSCTGLNHGVLAAGYDTVFSGLSPLWQQAASICSFLMLACSCPAHLLTIQAVV